MQKMLTVDLKSLLIFFIDLEDIPPESGLQERLSFDFYVISDCDYLALNKSNVTSSALYELQLTGKA